MKKISFLVCCSLFAFNAAKAQNRFNTPRVGEYRDHYLGLPLEEMKAALYSKQAAYNRSLKDCRNQVVDLYNSAGEYPEIKDGKHSVTITGPDMCQETYVIVDKGRVFSMPTNSGYVTDFKLSTPIKDALSKIGIPDAETGVTLYYDVVFLNDIFSK